VASRQLPPIGPVPDNALRLGSSPGPHRPDGVALREAPLTAVRPRNNVISARAKGHLRRARRFARADVMRSGGGTE
jgi:hypothetical protein